MFARYLTDLTVESIHLDLSASVNGEDQESKKS